MAVDYIKTVWVDESTPEINATNLNKIEQGIYDVNNAVFQNSLDLAKGLFMLQANILAGKNDLAQMAIDAFNDNTGISSGSSNHTYDATNDLFYPTGGYKTYAQLTATVTASDYYSTYVASNAYDNNGSTWWQSNVQITSHPYVTFDFGSAILPTSIILTNGQLTSQYHTVEYSDNGSSWTSDSTGSYIAYNATGQISVNAVSAHRYWRITITSASNPTSQASIAELFFNVPVAHDSMTLISNSLPAPIVPEFGYITLSKSVYSTDTFTCYISRDGGTTFTAVAEDTLVDITSQPSGSSLVVKVVVTGGLGANYSKLKAWAFGYR